MDGVKTEISLDTGAEPKACLLSYYSILHQTQAWHVWKF